MHTHLVHPRSVQDSGLHTPAERRCILVADGDADLHAIYGAVLEREGYRVLHAFSEAECFRLARVPRLCAALVSVGGCGLLAWRRLHQLARAAKARGFSILCLTTDPGLAAAVRRPPRGTVAVLMLPCTPDTLAAEVGRAVRGRNGQPN